MFGTSLQGLEIYLIILNVIFLCVDVWFYEGFLFYSKKKFILNMIMTFKWIFS